VIKSSVESKLSWDESKLEFELLASVSSVYSGLEEMGLDLGEVGSSSGGAEVGSGGGTPLASDRSDDMIFLFCTFLLVGLYFSLMNYVFFSKKLYM